MPEVGNSHRFEDVAKSLCRGAQPNQKLAEHFRRWARPMEDFPQVPVRAPMTRKMVVKALRGLDAAAITILTNSHQSGDALRHVTRSYDLRSTNTDPAAE